MHAVDTNVVARLFIKDDAEQTAAAQRAVAAQPIFVPKTVMVELEWVLRKVEDAAAVARAVVWFDGGMDFADALHLASSSHADSFLTFDAAMRRRASSLATRPPVVTPSA